MTVMVYIIIVIIAFMHSFFNYVTAYNVKILDRSVLTISPRHGRNGRRSGLIPNWCRGAGSQSWYHWGSLNCDSHQVRTFWSLDAFWALNMIKYHPFWGLTMLGTCWFSWTVPGSEDPKPGPPCQGALWNPPWWLMALKPTVWHWKLLVRQLGFPNESPSMPTFPTVP